MNIQVVGYGVVGKAQEFLMRQMGHSVTVYDPYVLSESQLSQNVDITFICAPEDVVEGVIERLMISKVQGLYVIKSTVPVGTTEGLMEKHRIHICHNPEFLREKYAFEDVVNPDRIVIGRCCAEHGELLANLYAPLGKPICMTVPKISELAKLVSNAHLSMLITFWNEVAQLADKLNISIEELAEIVTSDHRISKYGTSKFGEPFGGKCLPKDLDHLIRCYRTLGLNPIIFEAIKKYNEKLGGSNK